MNSTLANLHVRRSRGMRKCQVSTLTGIFTALWLALPVVGVGEGVDSAALPALEKAEPWSPHPEATPVTSKSGNAEVVIKGNGTRTCCGGWQFVFTGVRGGETYRFRTRVRHEGLSNAHDCLAAIVLWDAWEPAENSTGTRPWNYLLPKSVGDAAMDFEATLKAPKGATRLTVRYVFRWSQTGTSVWAAPRIETAAPVQRRAVKLCIVNSSRQTRDRVKTLPLSSGKGLPDDVARSVDLWGSLILAACRQKPQLVVTPEIVIGGKQFMEGAIEVPGPATEPFQKIAREHGVYLVLGVRERDRDAVFNSAVLISPKGRVHGVYRKVHLATSEGLSGTSAGKSFPVFQTDLGRIGCLICMDTTVCESMRMLALGGARIVCFPIMGDLRASRWSPGPPIFNEDRWKAIMRTRAIDNQVCMVVARNNVQGSCIIDRKGDILAWNSGDQEMIFATVPAEDGYRVWNGGDFREVTFLLRRPCLYEPYCDEDNLGPLDPGRGRVVSRNAGQ